MEAQETTNSATLALRFWEIFSDAVLLESFRLFLIKRHCEENLFYWIDVQKYKLELEENLEAEAAKIMKKYYEADSHYQLNVDAGDVKKLKSTFSSAPTRSMFEDTQKFCFQLMVSDSVPKFLKSQEYKLYTMDLEKKFEKKHKSVDKKNEKKIKFLKLKHENALKLQTQLDKDLSKSSGLIISYNNIDSHQIKEMESQINSSEEEWQNLNRLELALCSSSIASILQLSDTKLRTAKKNVTAKAIFHKQLEFMLMILSSSQHRNIVGFLDLLNEKWINHKRAKDEKLTHSQTSPRKVRLKKSIMEYSSPFTSENIATVSIQSSLLQLLDSVQVIMKKYPSSFEFSAKFILLIARLCCSKLPGISEMQLMNEDDEKQVVLPDFSSYHQLIAFAEANSPIFKNPSYSDVKSSEFEELLLIPSCSPTEEYEWNSMFSFYQSSNTKVIFDHSLKLLHDNEKLCNIVQRMNLMFSTLRTTVEKVDSFVKSVNIEDAQIESPGSPSSNNNNTGNNNETSKSTSSIHKLACSVPNVVPRSDSSPAFSKRKNAKLAKSSNTAL